MYIRTVSLLYVGHILDGSMFSRAQCLHLRSVAVTICIYVIILIIQLQRISLIITERQAKLSGCVRCDQIQISVRLFCPDVFRNTND